MFKHFNATFFLLTVYIVSIANGLLLGFLFWYIKDLNVNELLMGASNVVSGISNIIVFALPHKIIKVVGGNLAAINLAMLSFAIRYMAMSYLTEAWHVLFLQLFHGIGFALFWVAATSYASFLAPPGLTTTFIGILSGIHFGAASGSGYHFWRNIV